MTATTSKWSANPRKFLNDLRVLTVTAETSLSDSKLITNDAAVGLFQSMSALQIRAEIEENVPRDEKGTPGASIASVRSCSRANDAKVSNYAGNHYLLLFAQVLLQSVSLRDLLSDPICWKSNQLADPAKWKSNQLADRRSTDQAIPSYFHNTMQNFCWQIICICCSNYGIHYQCRYQMCAKWWLLQEAAEDKPS